MTDAADIRRAIERVGLRELARRAGCPVPAVQRLVARGAYPERGPHGAALRLAVAKVLDEPAPEAAGYEPGPGPTSEPTPEPAPGPVPERFARTAQFLATNRALEAKLPHRLAVVTALAALAGDLGYRLVGMVSLEPEAPAPEDP